MKCANCGEDNPTGNKFCVCCGRPLTEKSNQNNNVSTAKSDERKSEIPAQKENKYAALSVSELQKKRRNSIILCVFGIFFIIAGLAELPATVPVLVIGIIILVFSVKWYKTVNRAIAEKTTSKQKKANNFRK